MFHHFKIPGTDVDIKLIPLNCIGLVFAILAYQNIVVIFTGGVGKNGSTVAVRIQNVNLYSRAHCTHKNIYTLHPQKESEAHQKIANFQITKNISF